MCVLYMIITKKFHFLRQNAFIFIFLFVRRPTLLQQLFPPLFAYISQWATTCGKKCDMKSVSVLVALIPQRLKSTFSDFFFFRLILDFEAKLIFPSKLVHIFTCFSSKCNIPTYTIYKHSFFVIWVAWSMQILAHEFAIVK